jgi:DNA polymerase-3 subunit gamma/tau
MTEEAYEQYTDKYRPRTLDDVVGQKVAVGTIESMIAKGQINPTILISGPYGTGKTTLARIIARTINCATKNACGTCRSCVAMEKGNHTDVMELNAAEGRGIDTVRELIEVSKLAPRHNYRVLILDEVHQFTGPAAQALLKPLEEPSPRTIWILCTTDPQKILATIRSRSLQIKLQAVKQQPTVLLLKRVCKAENLAFPDKVLETIATLSDGHPRNALKLLEQVQLYSRSNGMPENLEEALPSIIDEMGSIPPEVLVTKYIQLLINGNYQALNAAHRVDNPEYFIQVAFRYLRGLIFEMKGVASSPEMSTYLAQTQFTRQFTHDHLVKMMELHLNGLEQAKRYGVDAADVLDLTVLKSLEVMQSAPRV